MNHVCRFAGSTSSLGWYVRLAGSLLSKAKQVLLYHSIPAFSSFLFHVFYLRVRREMEKQVTNCTAPYGWKSYTVGAAWCPEWFVSGFAIATPVPCSSWHNASHRGLGGPLSLYALPFRDKDPRVWFLKWDNGETYE
jgi:hypothetical protein